MYRPLPLLMALVACADPPAGDPAAVRPGALVSPGTAAAPERPGMPSAAGPVRGPEPEASGGSGGAGGGGGEGGEPEPRIVLTKMVEPQVPAALTYEAHHSGGMGAFDADGDGDLDLLITSDEHGASYLFNEGDFRFRPAPEKLQADLVRPSGVAAGDCDGDGDIDLFITEYVTYQLLINDGTGTLTAAPGSLREYADAQEPFVWGSSIFFDADGDEDLDLWVGCYTDGWQPGCPDRLFMNDGSCRFRDEWKERNLENRGYALGGALYDLDDDEDMDLVIANDFGMSFLPNRAYRNDGFGNFTEVARELALDLEIYGMGTLVADLDGDNLLDIYVANFARNPLFSPRAGGFLQRDEALGVDGGWIINPDQRPSDIPYYDPNGSEEERRLAAFQTLYMRNRPDDPHAFGLTAWAPTAADLDDDGFPELHVANGAIGIAGEAQRQPDRLYRRTGSGRFVDIAAEAGLTSHETKRTALWADLDGDGDLDAVIGQVERDPSFRLKDLFYRNDTRHPGHHVNVVLKGRPPNTSGIGARVTVRTGRVLQTQLRTGATSFLSANTGPLHFGVGDATVIDLVSVHWPGGGGTDRLASVPVDGVVVVEQSPPP